ncbi:MAG: outer membrane protein assembly factor BamE domain-containing protein, partial [Verrucomicrobiota bacterium]
MKITQPVPCERDRLFFCDTQESGLIQTRACFPVSRQDSVPQRQRGKIMINHIEINSWPRISGRVLPVLLLAMLLAGCASPGVFLEESAIDKIQPGMTRKEVLQIMGQPRKSHKGPDHTQLD